MELALSRQGDLVCVAACDARAAIDSALSASDLTELQGAIVTLKARYGDASIAAQA